MNFLFNYFKATGVKQNKLLIHIDKLTLINKVRAYSSIKLFGYLLKVIINIFGL